MLKNKVQEMKIPIHQLHRKNKLSTVMEESQTQSARTNLKMVTPRDLEGEMQPKQNNDEPGFELLSYVKEMNEESPK